jgi:hypothetical protein
MENNDVMFENEFLLERITNKKLCALCFGT